MVLMRRLIFPLLILFALTAILASCPGVSNADVLRLNDAIAPTVIIASPADGSEYGLVFTITGTVSDSATTAGGDGEVEALSYSVNPSAGDGDITVNADGSFSVDIIGGLFIGPQIITVTATDWNENDGSTDIFFETPKTLTYFAFHAADTNPGLMSDVVATIIGTNVNVSLPLGPDPAGNTARFEYTGSLIRVGGLTQISGSSVMNFEFPVTYTVVGNDGTTRDYLVTVN